MKRRVIRAVLALAVFSVASVGLGRLVLQGRAGSADRPSKDAIARDDNVSPTSALRLDSRRQQLSGVRTTAAVHGTLNKDVTGFGRVVYDESRIWDVNLKVEAWIRELYVSYVGQRVSVGQPLFAVFSPELDALQANLIGAIRTREQVPHAQAADGPQFVDRLIVTPRLRLKQFDVAEEEIKTLERTRQIPAALPFRSPTHGVVIEQSIVNGMHVEAGKTLYRLADLSAVIVEAELPESDLAHVKVGSQARMSFDALGDESFAGSVLSVYPYLTDESRTLKARIEVRNREGRLKPGMYARVALSTRGAQGVLVPIDAVIDSGSKQTVFVADGLGHFEPRTVATGGRSDEQILVLRGIREGEMVAQKATFLLDSESQLKAAFDNYAGTESPRSPERATREATLALELKPNPPRSGNNTFEVRVADADGRAVTDADVSIRLSMPAMPSMNMPAMHTDVELTHVGRGVYGGPGVLSMAGRWDATITARRDGRTIGTLQTAVIAR